MMTSQKSYADDVVTHIIKFCIADKAFAKQAFEHIASARKRTLELPDGKVTLNETEAGEFVERFSAEVEPTLWESKRLKS